MATWMPTADCTAPCPTRQAGWLAGSQAHHVRHAGRVVPGHVSEIAHMSVTRSRQPQLRGAECSVLKVKHFCRRMVSRIIGSSATIVLSLRRPFAAAMDFLRHRVKAQSLRKSQYSAVSVRCDAGRRCKPNAPRERCGRICHAAEHRD